MSHFLKWIFCFYFPRNFHDMLKNSNLYPILSYHLIFHLACTFFIYVYFHSRRPRFFFVVAIFLVQYHVAVAVAATDNDVDDNNTPRR